MYKVFFLLLMVFLSSGSYSKGIDREELIRVVKANRELADFSVDLRYMLFPSYSTHLPYSDYSGQYARSGKDQYLQIGEMITVSAQKTKIIVEKETETMFLLDYAEESLISLSPGILVNTCSAILPMEGLGEQQHGYILFFRSDADPNIQAMSFVFNPSTYMIEKVSMFYRTESLKEYGYNTKPRIEIRYTNYHIPGNIPAKVFSPDMYYTTKGGNTIGTGEYAGFKITDQRTRTK